ncbi:MAG TPA: hypothetical protein QGH10_10770 [Armatimonadota bacterium]|nr:hypothetical protein [Armatimonadota bacterium]
MRSQAKTALSILCVIGALVACGVAHAGQNPFTNLRNTPHAATSNGPQGAIVVQHRGRMWTTDRSSAARVVQTATDSQHSEQGLSQASVAMEFMRRNGIKTRDAKVRVPRTVVHLQGTSLILPDLARARDTGTAIGDAANNITFDFDGWSAADEADLANYLQDAMPIARVIYGPPAFDITVKVIRDDTLSELQGGTYDMTTNELRLPPMSGNFPEDTFVLMLLVLNAFHDDVGLFFDSWEHGFIGSAATAVQISPGVSPGYDPANPGPFYSGSVYDAMNQPGLGNSTWFPDSGFSGMLVWRIAQARAAWFKCYTEDSQFFRRFNTQYYALLNGLSAPEQDALRGDTPSLLEICQGVLPSMEGQSFFGWYRQQYALDTSTSVGPKLYTWNIPLFDAVALIVEHYDTTTNGDELPRGGTARTSYFNHDFTLTLFAQEGNEITIPATGAAAGEGFLIPTFFNVGGPQRITVQMDVNGLFAQYPFPYGVRGFDPGDNNLYGAIIGPSDGTIDVAGLGGLTDVKVERGVWGASISTTAMSPAKLQITFTDAQNNVVTRQVNVAFDTYDVLLTAESRVGVAKNFPLGANGLYLMSLPVTPVIDDHASALGIPADQLLLARWKPNAPGGGQYQIYPTIDLFRPGRGFWLRVLQDVTVAVDGLEANASRDVRTQMYAGWNMVGTGRNRVVDIDDVLIQRGAADTKTFADAAAAGWVQSGVWGYNQLAGYGLASQFDPFEGYWVRCLLADGALLVFPAPSTTITGADTAGATRQPYSALAGTEWQALVMMECGDRRGQAILGTAGGAKAGYDSRYDLQAPPGFGDQPSLGFVNADWDRDSGDYATDIRGKAARGPWRLRARGVRPGDRASLRWPDLTGVPADLRPVLKDLQTGRELSMRTTSAYEFTGSDVPREFEIELRPANQGALAVIGVLGLQTHQGAEITYSLSADAAVTARVLNIAGRPVRDIVQERVQSAGRSSLMWDLRSATGALVPSGTYIIDLTARSDDGQVSRAVGRISVAR